MNYISTRGQTAPRNFADVLLAGLAPDGGLFLPEAWPQFTAAEISAFAGLSYGEAAWRVLSRFAGGSFSEEDLRADIEAAYAGFDDAAIAPLSEIGNRLYLLELFHGPTLAFKDLALQILGRLFARALAKRGGRATVVAATSGDTGSAAIAALGGLPNIELFVLHPKGRVSEVQRLQMTTSPHANVHNIALEGTFDDAQAIVKSLFADKDFAERTSLTAVNSINFARIAAQCVYYFTAAAQLGEAPVFVVPTGNFGDVFAGEAAMRMGLGIEKLVVATNANDIMARALNDGVYAAGTAQADAEPIHGHSGRLQFRARAVRGERARCRLGARRQWMRSAARRNWCCRRRYLAALRARYTALAVDDDAHAGNDRRRPSDQRPLHRSAYRRGLDRGRGYPGRRQGPGGGALHRPSGQVPGCGAGGDRQRAPLAAAPQGPL